MKISKRVFVRLMVVTAFAFSPSAYSWDGIIGGRVNRIDFTVGPGGGAGNYDMRVYLVGTPTICTGGSNWAYINNTYDANYSTVAAALMMAKAAGTNVVLYTFKDSANYCHIGYVTILD